MNTYILIYVFKTNEKIILTEKKGCEGAFDIIYFQPKWLYLFFLHTIKRVVYVCSVSEDE
jgi:hypothetical protein